MIRIEEANVTSTAYETFKSWLLAEWTQVDQLADEGSSYGIPLPLLAFDGEKLVGGLSFISFKSPEDDKDGLWINTVYIDPKHRGKKIGQALVAEAVKVAKTGEHQVLYAYSQVPTLYTGLGWCVIHQEGRECVLKKTLE